jgi:hypothetical protein
VFVGAAALAVAGAAAAMTPGTTTAEAAPGGSPFIGSYVSSLFSGSGVPGARLQYDITIGKGGQVSGRGHGWVFFGVGASGAGRMKGSVSDAGRLATRVDETYTPISTEPIVGDFPIHNEFELHATVALDAAGNLTGTTDGGATFTWRRR